MRAFALLALLLVLALPAGAAEIRGAVLGPDERPRCYECYVPGRPVPETIEEHAEDAERRL